jgi:hypothetical protein
MKTPLHFAALSAALSKPKLAHSKSDLVSRRGNATWTESTIGWVMKR